MGLQDSLQRVYIYSAGYDDYLDALVGDILDLFPRERKDRLVLVKPNILGPHSPEKAVTTHPMLVRSVVRVLQNRGARVIVGDNPGMGGYGKAEMSARKCGVLECAGQCFVNLGHNPVRKDIASDYFSQATISGEILEADEVINLPKLKTHSLTVLTGAVKNTFGYVVGADKMHLHASCPSAADFARGLLDIYQVRPPELNIMDAVLAMQGNGPSNGTPVYLNRILASDNAVSLDAAASHMLGLQPSRVPHLDFAGERGLGETDPESLDIVGQLEQVQGFKFPGTFIPGITGLILNRYLSRWANCLPEVVSSRCISCGICAGHCPVGAMSMSSGGPVLDRDKCISCYCCQEMCPEDAIRLSGRFLRLLGRGSSRE